MPSEPGRVPLDEPLAYFLTWTTYRTWLPGDTRGWVNKPGQFRAPHAERQRSSRRRMTENALSLDEEQRRIVEDTISDHCRVRGWLLHVVNARTRHVHAVVSASGRKPDDVMDQFKAWCSRRLKEHQRSHPSTGEIIRQNWWTKRGSKRLLNDSGSLEAAVSYVLDEQGEATPRPAEEKEDSRG